ncbi:unnamed protein product, partial [Discosporangium mesarthrocarpum]
RRRQVVSLGAGKDTLFFRLREGGVSAPGGFFEVDFPEVLEWKEEAIKRRLYRLVKADLRDCRAVGEGLRAAGLDQDAPTLIIAECVLVYMKEGESSRIIQWCGSSFSCALFAAYEMTKAGDSFGRVMISNIQARHAQLRLGCQLPGLLAFPRLEDQEQRFLTRGWEACRAADMLSVFEGFIEPDEARRASQIEFLDEVEEWHLIMRHYCLVVAARGHEATRHLTATGLRQQRQQQWDSWNPSHDPDSVSSEENRLPRPTNTWVTATTSGSTVSAAPRPCTVLGGGGWRCPRARAGEGGIRSRYPCQPSNPFSPSRPTLSTPHQHPAAPPASPAASTAYAAGHGREIASRGSGSSG